MTVLATAFSTVTIGELESDFGAEARSRVSVDSAGAPLDLRTARSRMTTVSAAPLGLGTLAERQNADLGLTSDFAFVGFVGQIATDGMEITLAPEGPAFRFAVPGYAGSERPGGTRARLFPGDITTSRGAPNVLVDLHNDVQFGGITDRVRMPIITGGQLAGPGIVQPLVDTFPEVISGTGYLSRFRHVQIDYRKPAGEERFHGQIITDLVRLTGVPASRILISPTAGRPLLGLLELKCEEGIPRAEAIAESMGRHLIEDGSGNIVLRHMAPVDEPPVALIDLANIELDDQFQTLEPPSPRPKNTYKVFGSKPTPPVEGDGLVTIGPILIAEDEEFFAKPVATYRQNLNGTLTALSSTGLLPSVKTITRQVFRTETYREGGCLILQRDETFAFMNPEVPRYKSADPATADGTPFEPINLVLLFETGLDLGGGGSEPAFAFNSPIFAPVAITETRYRRDEFREIQQEGAVPVNPDVGRPAGWRGRETEVTTSTGGWRLDEVPFKVRATVSTPWTTVPVEAGLFLRGNGDPVIGPEVLFLGPKDPGDPTTGGAYPTTPAPGVPFGIPAMTLYTREYWSDVETVSNTVFEPDAESQDVFFDLATLQAARAATKPAEIGGVLFTDNVALDRLLVQINSLDVPAIGAEALVFPLPFGGLVSQKVTTPQGWERRPPTGAETRRQWRDGQMTSLSDISLFGRTLRVTTNNYIPSGTTHSDIASTTDADGRLKTTTTHGNEGHAPQIPVCDPELESLESQPVEGTCKDLSNSSLIDGVQEFPFDFGVEDAAAARDLACIFLRRDTALIAHITLPAITSNLHSQAPLSLTAKPFDPTKWIIPADYVDAQGLPHRSNSWAQDLVLLTDDRISDTDREVRKTTKALVRVAVYP